MLALAQESEHVEFKEGKTNLHFDKLVEYTVALAHEGGGCIVLGVNDRPPRRVVGTQAFELPARTGGGLHERLQIKVVCEEVLHADGRVLVFQVLGRPRGQALHFQGHRRALALQAPEQACTRREGAGRVSTLLYAIRQQPDHQQRIDSRALRNRKVERLPGLAVAAGGAGGRPHQAVERDRRHQALRYVP
ncbi:MAG: ATP-binding protein [Rubrivivax sp.]|nr:ATP-binding protein [Rubrivivax sp.]